jgi:hypothetical protein
MSKLQIPSKIQLIMAGIYIWSLISHYLSTMLFKFIQISIMLSIKLNLPIIQLGPWILSKSRRKINLFKAYTKNKDLTQQIKLFLNWYWDSKMCDEMGGISLNLLHKILPKDIHKLYFIYTTSELTHEIQSIIENLHFLTIDLSKSSTTFYITKMANSSEKEILFNQISFDPLYEY